MYSRGTVDTDKQMTTQASQSLFQVLYLGSTVVDQHCSHAVMPWITEQLKLRTEQRVLTWLTSGDTGVSYVADSGVELFRHPHSNILRCATGTDGITFSYIVQDETQQCSCHVFQCLTPDEAALLMKKFRSNAGGEKVVQSPPVKQPPPTCTNHTVHYVGSVEIPSFTQSSDLLDNVLEKLRKRQRSLAGNAMAVKKCIELDDCSSGDSMEVLTSPKSPVLTISNESGTVQDTNNTIEVTAENFKVAKLVEMNSVGNPDPSDSRSISSQSITSLTDRQMHMTREESCDVSIKLTRATPERVFYDEEDKTIREREGEGGKVVTDGDWAVKTVLTQPPDIASSSVEEQPPLYSSDIDDNLSDSPSSTSCTTPEPAAVEDLTPAGGITLVHSDFKLLHKVDVRLELVDGDDRPSSCPPLEGDMAEENCVDGGESVEVDEGTEDGKAELEPECDETILKIPLRSSTSDAHIKRGGSGRGESEDKEEGRKALVRSRSFERPRMQPSRTSEAMEVETWGDEPDIGFDTLPELQSLQESSVFQALGGRLQGVGVGGGGGGRGVSGREEVRLVISPNMVQVVKTQSSKVILRRTIRSIACCAQGEKKAEFVGFVCREGKAKTFICHIFKAPSQAMATAVMDSFKSSFLHALNSSPTAMCENCPLQQLHALCQNLEGVSTPVAQSRIQECLSQLSEADYNCIMSEYKSSEHADHEFTQLVVLVSLIREHLQKKQQEHIHPIHNVAGTSGTNHHQTLKPPRLSKLERAKLALTNSFDNLRKGSIRNSENRKRRFGKSMTMEENTGTAPLLTTENRRASLDPKELAKKRREKTELVRTLSAKVPVVRESGGGDSSGSEEGGRGGRSRSSSWLQRFRPSKPVSSSQEDVSDNEARKTDGEREPSPLTSSVMQEDPKKLKPAQKVENFESKEDLTSEPLPAHTQSSSTPTPVLSPNKSSPPPSVTPPPSTVPSSIFKTPTRTPMWRKPNMRAQRAHTRATFSPPPTEGSRAAVEKYRREHKRSESMSWRHEIFESVTPVKERNTEKHNSFQDWEIIEPASFDQLGGSTTIHCTAMGGEGEELRGRGSPRTVARERWRRAIEQQIMLQRMEKQNQTIIKASTEADTKRLKLCYKDPSIHVDNISRKWAELLSRPLPLEQSELRPILLEGITPARRGEVWSLLIQLYQDTHPSLPPSPPAPPSPLSFTELCQESTEYENAIRMDLGRTFPSHPYFSTVEGRGGQEALANMLHAYAVSDKDIGYCQGLSFVAGMILMHTKDEESAYKLLCHLMHVYGYRDVYSPDLSVLQLRLYQLSRLLHDVLPTLHSHLGSYDITPFYYAAPWFLTLFSSQYPIAFVARVMDLFFLEGPDIVFKVAVALLRFYETRILRCTTMESISEFLKERMPQLVLNHMITILNDALHMDLESKLQSFETEYFVLEELTTSFSVESEVQDLKSLNESFRSHNKELIEQLAFCRGMISNLEATVTILQETVRQQQLRLDRLEGGQPSPSLSTPPADESTAALS